SLTVAPDFSLDDILVEWIFKRSKTKAHNYSPAWTNNRDRPAGGGAGPIPSNQYQENQVLIERSLPIL
ncbi:MAG: hypothetical protein RLN85_04120, partial [Pseudomonadales bacterium]